MEAIINIDYNQVLRLIEQMPVHTQLRLGRELTRRNIRSELNHFLEAFHTDELSEEDVLTACKAVRRERHARK